MGEGGSFVGGGGGTTLGRGSEGEDWREKGERGVFEKAERDAWRWKSVKVALRGRGDDESRHGQGAGGRWER